MTAQERPRGATLYPRSGAVAGRSYPTSEVGGGSQEEPHHVQRAVAVQAQEGLEEPSHVEGRSGRAAVRRYPSSKVRSSGCALLEQQ